jgi:hypothetical protein
MLSIILFSNLSYANTKSKWVISELQSTDFLFSIQMLNNQNKIYKINIDGIERSDLGSIMVFNLLGEKILEETIYLELGANKIIQDFSAISQHGLYIIQIKVENKVDSKKIKM